MSETLSLDWIGQTLRTMQAEQRSIRDENALIRSAIIEMSNVLLARVAAFEGHTDTRIDNVERRIGEALTGINDLKEMLARLAPPKG